VEKKKKKKKDYKSAKDVALLEARVQLAEDEIGENR